MLQVELGLLSNGGIWVERRLDAVSQAGNVHGCECVEMSGQRSLELSDTQGRCGVGGGGGVSSGRGPLLLVRCRLAPALL